MKARFERPEPTVRVKATWEVPFRLQSYEISIAGFGKFTVDATQFETALMRARERAGSEHREYLASTF